MSSLQQVAAREEEHHRMAREVMTTVAKLQEEIVPCGVADVLGIAGIGGWIRSGILPFCFGSIQMLVFIGP